MNQDSSSPSVQRTEASEAEASQEKGNQQLSADSEKKWVLELQPTLIGTLKPQATALEEDSFSLSSDEKKRLIQ
jgi:hypothetical protein